MHQRPIAINCTFTNCMRQTRRAGCVCVLHINSSDNTPNTNKTHTIDNTYNINYLKKLYEQIKIEKTLDQYKKVLSELEAHFTIDIDEWEIVC